MVSIVDYKKKKNYIIYLVHRIRNPIKNIQCSRYVYGISVESNIRNFKIERLNLKKLFKPRFVKLLLFLSKKS